MKLSRSGMGKPQAITLAVVLIALALMLLLIGNGSDGGPHSGPVLICIDSTVSTDDVRGKYEQDIKEVVRRAALHQAHFYAAACGANATGEVDWPVSRRFEGTYSGKSLNEEQLEHKAEQVMFGTSKSEGIKDLLEVESHDGTPIGEMLAVTGRQCEQAGGDCAIYLFTDGEWADELLRVRDGISEGERKGYLDVYVDRLSGLSGSTVNFVGVGLGTQIGEVRLDEAHTIVTELVEKAGGTVGFWTTRL